MNKEHFFSPYPTDPYAKPEKCSCVEEEYDIFTVFSFWFCLPQLIKYYEGRKKIMNSAEFKRFKLHSDSTLKRLTKDDLIDYIHALHHNWSVAAEQLENVIKNVDELIKEARESNKEIPQRPSKRYYSDSYGNGGRMKRVDIRCPFCSSSFTNGVRTSIGVFATREKDFIETVENQNYCWNCGQRLDWSESK